MTKNKTHLLVLSVLLIISLWLVKPFSHRGFFPIHDNQSVGRLYELDQALKDGQFPVRWVKDLGFGFGYPLFIFYPPLTYYAGEVWHMLGFGYLDSIKIVYALSLILSGFAMYRWASYRWPPEAAFLASLFYIFAPYRAVDLYVRGALAECFSFVFIPLVFYYLDRFFDHQDNLSALKAGIAFALLMMTHNLIVLPMVMLLLIYVVVQMIGYSTKRLPGICREKTCFTIINKAGVTRAEGVPSSAWTPVYRRKPSDGTSERQDPLPHNSAKLVDYLPGLLIFTVSGLSLSAFFWLPALLYKNDTIVSDILLQNKYDFRLHFVAVSQLWNSLWGFGGSEPGTLDGMSFKVGKIHLLGAAAAFVLAVLKAGRKQIKIALLWFILLLVSLSMTTALSRWVWDLIPPLHFLQFPWRFLTFAVLFCSILAGYLIHTMRTMVPKIFYYFFYGLLVWGLVVPNLKLFQPQEYMNVADQDFISEEAIKWQNSGTSFEFAPRGIQLVPNEKLAATLRLPITQNTYARRRIEEKENYQIQIKKDQAHRLEFTITALDNIDLQLNMFAFPGWGLTVDGRKQNYRHDNQLRLITFPMASGEHRVELTFRPGIAIKMADYWSLTTWVLMLWFMSMKYVYPKTKT